MTRPRIRTLKPELWQSRSVGKLSFRDRLLFLGLITMADDAGRLAVVPRAIAGHVFPYDDAVKAQTVLIGIAELQKHDLVRCYEVDGDTYLWLPNWRKHQRINRVTPSTLPPPPDPEGSWDPHDVLTEDVVSTHTEPDEGSPPHARACAPPDRIGSGTDKGKSTTNGATSFIGAHAPKRALAAARGQT